MSHEQSETVQLPNGKWINVYGGNTPQRGQKLPDSDIYDSMNDAISAAEKRSKAYGRGRPPFARQPRGSAEDRLSALNQKLKDSVGLGQTWDPRHGVVDVTPGTLLERARKVLGPYEYAFGGQGARDVLQAAQNLTDPQTWYEAARAGTQSIEDVYNQTNTKDLPTWQRIPTNLGYVLSVGQLDPAVAAATALAPRVEGALASGYRAGKRSPQGEVQQAELPDPIRQSEPVPPPELFPELVSAATGRAVTPDQFVESTVSGYRAENPGWLLPDGSVLPVQTVHADLAVQLMNGTNLVTQVKNPAELYRDPVAAFGKYAGGIRVIAGPGRLLASVYAAPSRQQLFALDRLARTTGAQLVEWEEVIGEHFAYGAVDPRAFRALMQQRYGRGGQGQSQPALGDATSPLEVESVMREFDDVYQQHLGSSEQAMGAAVKHLGTGVMSGALEHTGDLLARMTNGAKHGYFGYEEVREKTLRLLQLLQNPYAFEREYRLELRNTAAYRGIRPDGFRRTTEDLLRAYREAHARLPAYNYPQWLAREAAVSLGDGRYATTTQHLQNLMKLLVSRETFDQHASQYWLDPKTGRLVPWQPKMPRLNVRETPLDEQTVAPAEMTNMLRRDSPGNEGEMPRPDLVEDLEWKRNLDLPGRFSRTHDPITPNTPLSRTEQEILDGFLASLSNRQAQEHLIGDRSMTWEQKARAVQGLIKKIALGGDQDPIPSARDVGELAAWTTNNLQLVKQFKNPHTGDPLPDDLQRGSAWAQMLFAQIGPEQTLIQAPPTTQILLKQGMTAPHTRAVLAHETGHLLTALRGNSKWSFDPLFEGLNDGQRRELLKEALKIQITTTRPAFWREIFRHTLGDLDARRLLTENPAMLDRIAEQLVNTVTWRRYQTVEHGLKEPTLTPVQLPRDLFSSRNNDPGVPSWVAENLDYVTNIAELSADTVMGPLVATPDRLRAVAPNLVKQYWKLYNDPYLRLKVDWRGYLPIMLVGGALFGAASDEAAAQER